MSEQKQVRAAINNI